MTLARKFCKDCGRWRLLIDFGAKRWDPLKQAPEILRPHCQTCDARRKRLAYALGRNDLIQVAAMRARWRKADRQRGRTSSRSAQRHRTPLPNHREPMATSPELAGYVFGLVVEQPGLHRSVVEDDPLLHGIKDPDYECVHGRLPGDRTPPCGCWGTT